MPIHYVENFNSPNNKETYDSLTRHKLLPEEQKGYHKEPWGKGELLFIDQHVLTESKTRRENLALVLIDLQSHKIWYGKAGK